ncbi:unnamed protein product [Tuber aestivum]|uniref:Glucose-methanol-choline oxidoreductase N-terminal domain-containing protein n=1 Tax=Tuber aestivum TaxID=59557 RepID=A0A292PYD0_9PEZI|nr:unnamed protein product [Tuber aestivum]
MLGRLVLLFSVASAFMATLVLGKLIGKEEQLLDSYTYVIVGGGTAVSLISLLIYTSPTTKQYTQGLTVANRLSEDPDATVLVLEAGIPDRKECAAILQRCLGDTMRTVYDWNITTEPQIYLNGRGQSLFIGKALGGSSMLNGMMFDRGAPGDYDMWEDLGNPGWGWDGLLPYFKKHFQRHREMLPNAAKSETFTPPKPEHVAQFGITYDPAVHGFDGYVQSGYPNFIYPQTTGVENFQEAMKSLGVAQSLDQAGEALGAFWSPNSIDPKNMTRSYARSAYFDNFVDRQNLHVYTSRHVTKLITEDDDEESGEGVKICGVEYVKTGDATKYIAKAKKEVIISAGAVHTPQILQLSGIGQKSLLEKLGIPVLIDLPGVGQNFQDHPFVTMALKLENVEHSVIDLELNASWDAESKALFYSSREGPWTAGSPNSIAFLPLSTYTNKSEILLGAYTAQEPGQHLRNDLEPAVTAGFQKHHKILLNRLAGTRTAAMEFIWLSGANRRFQMPLSISIAHPFSRGFIEINSTDPHAAPIVDLRTGSNPVDLSLLVEALRFNRRIVQSPAIQELAPTELTPGQLLQADEELLGFTRANLSTMFHPSGTAAMQPREIGGVVDHNLMVYGTRNLRVVDASIMPLIPGSHLASTVYAIGEKAADIIKAARK